MKKLILAWSGYLSKMPFLFFLMFIYTQDNFSQIILYYNGNIFTSDSNKPFIGYFISEDGIISETGDTIASQRISQFENKVDLQAKTIIPGIVDSHIHFIDGSLGLLQISLSDIANSDELRDKIKSTSSQLLDGFYVARDLGFSALSGVDSPREFLDALLPDSPAIIFLKSGHAAVANTAGLRKLGFTERTKIPDGTIGTGKDGNLNGWLLEAAAMEGLKRVGSKYSEETIQKAIQIGQELALSYGITTLGDNTFSPYNMKIYQFLQRKGDLNLRMWTRSYGRIPQTTSLMKPMGIKKLGFIGPENDFDRVHYHLIKLFEDMSLSVPPGMTGNIEPGGTVYLDKNEIKKYLLLHPDDKFAFHVQGEKGLQNIIDALDELGTRNNNRRHVIDHAGYCTEKQLEELKNLGESVTILASQTFDYPTLLREYSSSNSKLREDELLDARLKYNVIHGALSSDFPYGMDTSFIKYKFVDGLNPFPNMAINVSGKMPDGIALKDFDNKTLSIQEAVKSYTANGAYVLSQENLLGKISPGYVADFAVLDRNIFDQSPMDLYNCKIEQTYSGGKKVYDRNEKLSSEDFSAKEKINPYDYTISPVFGYDPSTGFVFGAAGFIYPLTTPASYGDVQVMATIPGKIQIQSSYMRYGIFKNTDFKVPITFNTFPQYYFGENDTTSGENYIELFSNRYLARPEFIYSLPNHLKAAVFADFRARKETSVQDKNGELLNQRLFPDEQNLGLGLSLIYDTRDNPGSTKLGFYGSAYYENVSGLNTSTTGNAGLLGADIRYFHYIYTSKYVFAARFSGGTSFGRPSYLYRYSLGGPERLRGYYSNRFRGNNFYSVQTEFRFPVYKKFSGVCFVDEGDVSDGKLDKVLFSYGGGIRFSINDNVALRLDYGRGKDQNGVFFTFGEAF
ncbi:MAG: amidohydrolase family protein [Bacteroidales bacterium]|nr:amidohydrolase family protein [Bacteroidales bacterium]